MIKKNSLDSTVNIPHAEYQRTFLYLEEQNELKINNAYEDKYINTIIGMILNNCNKDLLVFSEIPQHPKIISTLKSIISRESQTINTNENPVLIKPRCNIIIHTNTLNSDNFINLAPRCEIVEFVNTFKRN